MDEAGVLGVSGSWASSPARRNGCVSNHSPRQPDKARCRPLRAAQLRQSPLYRLSVRIHPRLMRQEARPAFHSLPGPAFRPGLQPGHSTWKRQACRQAC